MSRTHYVTTPIYYVNDAPHIGHAYTTIAADVWARWHRLSGRKAFMLTGTDEHGQKVFRAAQERGLTPQQHVDAMSEPYKVLWARLGIAYDDFIRTTEPRHTRIVQQVLQDLHDRGELYAADYEGWYSTSAERFWTEKDLVDGKCPDSGQPVEWIKEKNWFFRMSKYADRFRTWMEEHPDFVQPASRRNEVLGALRKEIGDLCISRPRTRLPWGIALPFDPDYVTYVWFDALLNYITAVGFRSDPERFESMWPCDVHLLGKDILTTHSIYWSTMLFALGLEPARLLYAHGWWTIEGRKMSKSLGNVVDPHLLLDCYGPDAVRYFLLREIPFGVDGDFNHAGFMTRYNADLANDLGNLAHRALSMTEKWLGGRVPTLDPATAEDEDLQSLAVQVVERFRAELEGMRFSRALEALWELVRAGNKYIDTMEPWALNREGRSDRLAGVMRRTLEVCRVAGTLLTPIFPGKAGELLAKLGVDGPSLDGVEQLGQLTEGREVSAGDPLFPRMMALPDRIQAVLEQVQEDKEAPMEEPKATPKPTPAQEPAPRIKIDDFAKVELRSGQVLAAEPHPNADRLLVLTVDVGEPEPRTIVAGLASRYAPDQLVGLRVVVVVNLKPAKLRGIRSEGMILAAGGGAVQAMVTLSEDVDPGTVVR